MAVEAVVEAEVVEEEEEEEEEEEDSSAETEVGGTLSSARDAMVAIEAAGGRPEGDASIGDYFAHAEAAFSMAKIRAKIRIV